MRNHVKIKDLLLLACIFIVNNSYSQIDDKIAEIKTEKQKVKIEIASVGGSVVLTIPKSYLRIIS